MRITDVIIESYDLDLLEQRFLNGEQLTESELTALMEGPRWDAVKKAAAKLPGQVAKGLGTTVRGVGTGVGAVAGAVPGVGRAIKKGYSRSSDYIGGKPQQAAAPQAAPATTPAGTGVGSFAKALAGMSETDRLAAVAQVLKTFTPKQMKAIRKLIK